MADTGAFADLGNSIKEVYNNETVEVLTNNETKFRPWLKKTIPAGATHEKGGYLTYLANTIGDPAVGQAADNGALPPTVDRTDVRLQLKPTAFYGSVSFGVMTMNALDSNNSTWNKGEVARQTNQRLIDVAKFMESTYTGTHGTGRRARVESDGTNTFVASLPEGIGLLKEGYYLSARTTDGGATVRDSVDGRRITAINRATRTVTYSGADQTLVAGDHIHVVTETSQTLTNVFANGLRGLVDDATFLTTVHGASRSTHPKLKAQAYTNGGTLRNLSEQLILNSILDIRDASGKNVTDIWTGYGQALKWVEFLAPDKRIMPVGMEGTGNKAMGFNEGDLVIFAPGVKARVQISYDIVPREMYLLNADTFYRYAAKDLGWLTPDQMFHLSPGTANYKATLLGFMAAVENIGINGRFDANGVIRDLKDPRCGD